MMSTSLFVGALFAGLLSSAAACSCAAPSPDAPKCGREGQYVLHGVGVTNTNIECVSEDIPTADAGIIAFQNGVTLARFEVTTVLRQPEGGTLEDGDVVNVRSSVAGNLCGYQVQPGVEYVLFASERDPEDCETIPIALPAGGSELTFFDTTLNLGTSLCAGNVRTPTSDMLGEIVADCEPDNEAGCESDCEDMCDNRCTRKCGLGNFTFMKYCVQLCDKVCNRHCIRKCEMAV